MQLKAQAKKITRHPFRLLLRLRMALFGHEELFGIVFWATLIGIAGALASILFRAGIRLCVRIFTGFWTHAEHGSGLVPIAVRLAWWHRAIIPVVGGLLAGALLLLLRHRFVSSMAIEPSTISEANSAPEIGALYAAAIPAATPHATIRRSRGTGARASSPIREPSIAASCTIEPSRPIEPPEAMVSIEPRLFRIEARKPMRPSPTLTASM